MRTQIHVMLSAGVLACVGQGGLAKAQAPPSVPPRPVGTPSATASSSVRPAPATRAVASTPVRPTQATPASYWGPTPPPVPRRKPTAVGRFFNRIGTFLGADEEMGTTPTYRDPSTGRTNTGGSKPYLKRMDQ